MVGLLPVIATACFGLVLPPTAAVTHYERPPCQSDEVQGEVLGISGYVCAPRCVEGTYDCPGDVPDLAAARPQCMLKDADQGAFCTLLCTVDSQCPTSARCTRLQQAGVGICMYPLAFSDWVRQGNSKRLTYGLPQRTDKKVPPGVVQKAVAAVQNLKAKYGIQDGDVDVVAVKEFLTTLSGASVGSAGIVPAMPPGLPAAPIPSAIAPAPPPPSSQSNEDPTLKVYKRDFNYHMARLGEGLPGLEKEISDDVWRVEHLGDRYAASDLLRQFIELFLVYIIIGAIYKNQALGAEGIDMIPHIGFWMEYPAMVQDGITYSQQIVGSYLGMDFSGSSGYRGDFLPVGRGERDTFAHFEPSK